MLAARNLPAVRVLLAAGANPATPMRLPALAGSTVLHQVGQFFSSGAEEQAAVFLQAKLSGSSNPKAKEKMAETSAKLAQVRADNLQQASQVLVELAHAAGTVDVLDANGRTPLMVFLAQGNLGLARQALALGADPFLRDDQGLDALGVALQAGQVSAAHAMLGHLRDIGKIDCVTSVLIDAAYASPEPHKERRPFVAALHSLLNEPEVAQWVAARDDEGLTPLLVAAATAQEDLVELLLVMGANPDITDSMDNTALHHGMGQQKPDIARMLRAAGAQIDVENAEGVTPIQVAEAFGKAYLVRSLTDPVETVDRDWTIPEETRAAIDVGSDALTSIQPRSVAASQNARIKMGL